MTQKSRNNLLKIILLLEGDIRITNGMERKGDLRGGGGFITRGLVAVGGSPSFLGTPFPAPLRIGLPERLFKRAAWRVIAEKS